MAARALASARRVWKGPRSEGCAVCMCAVSRRSGGVAKAPQVGHHWPPLWATVLVVLHFGHSAGLVGWVASGLAFIQWRRAETRKIFTQQQSGSCFCRITDMARACLPRTPLSRLDYDETVRVGRRERNRKPLGHVRRCARLEGGSRSSAAAHRLPCIRFSEQRCGQGLPIQSP